MPREGCARGRLRRWAPAPLLALACLALLAPAASAKRPSDRELVDVYTAVEGAQLGEVLPGGPEKFITVVDSPKQWIIVHEYGRTYKAGALTEIDWNEAGTEATGATITIYSYERSGSEARLRGTIAHEVFHVFEARMSGDEELADAHEGWLEEGAASWVASDLVAGDPTSRGEWADYLSSPGTVLFDRLYDAIGFFGHMASSGIDPWKRFKAMFTAPNGESAYGVAVGGSAAFLDSQAAAFFREPALGSVWEQTGANVPSRASVGFSPPKVTIGTHANSPVTLSVPGYADGAYALTLAPRPAKEALFELVARGSGDVRLRSTAGGAVDLANSTRVLLCSNPGGCNCPTAPPDAKQFERGNVAIAPGTSGEVVQIGWLGQCDRLLRAPSCANLLPGFTAEGAAELETAIEGARREGFEPAGASGLEALGLTATSVRGSGSASTCAFEYKGTFGTNAEGERTFAGVVAPFVSVVQAPSVGGAKVAFKVLTAVIPGAHPPGIGEEAILQTSSTPGARGVSYGSIAAVRVQNLIAYYGLYSTPGNTEATPGPAAALLQAVAARL